MELLEEPWEELLLLGEGVLLWDELLCEELLCDELLCDELLCEELLWDELLCEELLSEELLEGLIELLEGLIELLDGEPLCEECELCEELLWEDSDELLDEEDGSIEELQLPTQTGVPDDPDVT